MLAYHIEPCSCAEAISVSVITSKPLVVRESNRPCEVMMRRELNGTISAAKYKVTNCLQKSIYVGRDLKAAGGVTEEEKMKGWSAGSAGGVGVDVANIHCGITEFDLEKQTFRLTNVSRKTSPMLVQKHLHEDGFHFDAGSYCSILRGDGEPTEQFVNIDVEV